MNKKVIALAVAGALALPLAAKAQTANVTMYGSFRLAMETLDVDKVGRSNAINSWSSRWGIRGIESLGGGLNGVFQLETGVNLDYPGGVTLDGTAVSNNFITIREAWAGLNGGFGTVKMGAGLTAYDDVFGMDHLLLANGIENMNNLGGGVNPIISSGNNFSGYGSVAAVSGAGRTCNNSTAFDARYGNSIRYDSPNFSGLTFATQFAFLGENASGFKCKGWDSNVIYNNGPFEGGLTYARHIDFQQYDGAAWRAHLGWNLGFVKFLGAYEEIKLDGNNGSTGSGKTKYFVVGAVVPIGPGWLTAQYGDRNHGISTSATAVTEISNGGGQQFTMSYKYGFSKRTYVYAFGGQLKADSAASVLVAGSQKTTGGGFGIQHNF